MTALSAQHTAPTDDTPIVAEVHQVIETLQNAQPVWINEPKASIQIRLDGAGNTWVWRQNRRNHLSYFLINNTLFVDFYFDISLTLPTAEGVVRIRLPNNYHMVDRGSQQSDGVDTRQTLVPIYLENAGTAETGIAYVSGAASSEGGSGPANTITPDYIAAARYSGNWTAGAVAIIGQLFCEVAPGGTLSSL